MSPTNQMQRTRRYCSGWQSKIGGAGSLIWNVGRNRDFENSEDVTEPYESKSSIQSMLRPCDAVNPKHSGASRFKPWRKLDQSNQ